MRVSIPAWVDHAACRGTDPAIFFPATPGRWGGREEAVRRAALVCARCPVIERCREWSAGETHGIWAGIDREKEVPA